MKWQIMMSRWAIHAHATFFYVRIWSSNRASSSALHIHIIVRSTYYVWVCMSGRRNACSSQCHNNYSFVMLLTRTIQFHLSRIARLFHLMRQNSRLCTYWIFETLAPLNLVQMRFAQCLNNDSECYLYYIILSPSSHYALCNFVNK